MKKFLLSPLVALSIIIAVLYPSQSQAAFQTPDIRLDTGDAPGASNSRGPHMCNTSDGHVYVVFWDDRNYANGEIFFNHSSDYGVTWLSEPTVISFSLPEYTFGLDISCTEDGHVYVAFAIADVVSTTVIFTGSSDHGASWGPYRNIDGVGSEPPPDPLGSFFMPVSISSTEDGHVYVVWTDHRNYYPSYETDVFFATSPDYGVTWFSAWQLNTALWGATNPKLSNTEDGYVFVVWEDYRNDFLLLGYRDIFYNYSSNYGLNWQASDIQIDEDVGGLYDSYWLEICNIEDGHVYIAWSDNRNGSYNPYFNRSADYGVSWQSSDTRLNTGDIPGANNSYSSNIGCTSNGYVYSIYIDRRNVTNYDIYFNYSSDYGVTWQTPDIRVDLGDNLGQNLSTNAKLVNDDIGNIYASFMDTRNGGWDILFTKSSDYGATWLSLPERVNTGSSPGSGAAWCQQISADSNGHIYIAWKDERTVSGVGDIYFNYWTPPGPLIPTLSDYMMVVLAFVLLFSLFFIIRRRHTKYE